VTGLPVTHDVTRLKTLGLWLVAALLGAAIVRRLGGSRPAALAAFVLAFLHLERLCLEPGHPQELCVVALLAVPLVAGGARAAWRPVVLGLIAATVVMTKPNVGVLLAVAVRAGARRREHAVSMDGAAPCRRAVPATLLLPFAIAHRHLLAPKRLVLPPVAASAAFAVLVVARRHVARGCHPFTSRDLLGFVAGFTTVVGACAVAALAGGTTVRGLAYGLVGQHLAFVAAFASPAPIPTVLVACAALGVVFALRSADDARMVVLARTLAALALGWTCLRDLAETSVPLTRPRRIAPAAACWSASPPPALGPPRRRRARRRPVSGAARACLVAALQPLGAYPRRGRRWRSGRSRSVLAAALALDDGLPRRPTDSRPRASPCRR
jgi:hypothetical protein